MCHRMSKVRYLGVENLCWKKTPGEIRINPDILGKIHDPSHSFFSNQFVSGKLYVKVELHFGSLQWCSHRNSRTHERVTKIPSTTTLIKIRTRVERHRWSSITRVSSLVPSVSLNSCVLVKGNVQLVIRVHHKHVTKGKMFVKEYVLE